MTAIANYTERVADTFLDPEQRRDALYFLDHVSSVSFLEREVAQRCFVSSLATLVNHSTLKHLRKEETPYILSVTEDPLNCMLYVKPLPLRWDFS